MGLFDKVKNVFGKKEEPRIEIEEPRRIATPEPVQRVAEEDQPGNLYLKARKWREQQAMQEPLVKRSEYKKKW
jgi:hypothetical protein